MSSIERITASHTYNGLELRTGQQKELVKVTSKNLYQTRGDSNRGLTQICQALGKR